MPATLLLTRPRTASERLLRVVQAALGEVTAIISPIMRIEPVGEPDLSGQPHLIVTSANGARFAGDLRGHTAWVVGKRTAQAVRQAGGQVALTAPDSAALLRHLADNRPATPLVWLRGRHVASDIAGPLNARGLATREIIVYDQVAQPPGPGLLAALQGERPAILPLYSPRSATLTGAAIERRGRGLHVICMSPAVASAWRLATGGESEICAAPEGAEMERRIIAALQQSSA